MSFAAPEPEPKIEQEKPIMRTEAEKFAARMAIARIRNALNGGDAA